MPSKTAKTRKHNRKRAHMELGARRTEASRKRRLDNKAKRDEIHAINPDVKVKIINEKTYIDGWEFAVENGKLVCKEPTEIVNEPVDIKIQTNEQKMAEIGMIPSSLPEGTIKTECDYEGKVEEIIDIGEDLSEFIEPTVEVFNPEIEEVEAVEVHDVSKFQKLVKKWRK